MHPEESGVDMKSVEILFGITQNEYSNEHERTTMIQSKAGIALPTLEIDEKECREWEDEDET